MIVAERKPDQKKQAILDAAINILALEGYPKFTLRNVASKVGVRIATVQHYFSNKRELLNAAILKTSGAWDDRLDEISERANMSPESRVRRAVEIHYLSCVDPLTAGFFIALRGLAAHDRNSHELLSEIYRSGCERLAKLIMRMNPKLNKAGALNKSILIISLIEGSNILMGPGKLYEGKGAELRDRMLDGILEYVRTTDK